MAPQSHATEGREIKGPKPTFAADKMLLLQSGPGRALSFLPAVFVFTMTPAQITDQMMAADAFSQWLGIERIEDGLGRCTLRMRIRPEMLNGFGIAHGGITYALADSALAFASNSHGRQAVSVETSISHTRPLRAGDLITATAAEEHLGGRIAIYRVEVTNADGQLVALFKGTVFRTEKEWS